MAGFDFDVPSRALEDEEGGVVPDDVIEEDDQWFAEAHMHLLRPINSHRTQKPLKGTGEGAARSRTRDRASAPAIRTARKASTFVEAPEAAAGARPRRQSRPEGTEKENRGGEGDLEALLARHNKKIKKKKVQYEPRAHGVRDVRMWERATGRKYAELSFADRAEANEQIRKMKQEREAE